MKKIIYTMIITCLVSSSFIMSACAFEVNDNIPIKNNKLDIYEISNDDEGIMPRTLMYDENISDDDGHYITTDMAAATNGNINIFYKNNTDNVVTITFQKQGLFNIWSDVDSFEVDYNTSPEGRYITVSGKKGAIYRVKVDSNDGAKLNGRLRVNQL